MVSRAVAAFLLVVLAGSSIVQAGMSGTELLSALRGIWKRTFDVHTQTNVKLKAKGYDMPSLGKYVTPALEAAEACYDEEMKAYPDFAEPLKVEYKAGIANFPNEGWNSNMLDCMVNKTREKESNETAAALILNKALSKPLSCFRIKIQELMKVIPVEDPDNAGKINNLYECVNGIYQGEWRNWNGICNATGSFWTRCQDYEACKIFESSNA